MSESGTATISSASAPGSVRQVAEPADLVCIFEPAVQVTHLKRERNALITEALDALALRGLLIGGCRVELPANPVLAQRALPDFAGRDAVEADILHLHELFVDLVGCPATGLRFEVLDRAMCPRFHVDNVGVRLLCTYRGPATEWIDDAHADRSKLKGGAHRPPDATSGLVRDWGRVERAEPFDVVLLKGGAWPGNELLGGIHRSPEVPVEQLPRVMVSLDALWPLD